jgi:hypothetical protein
VCSAHRKTCTSSRSLTGLSTLLEHALSVALQRYHSLYRRLILFLIALALSSSHLFSISYQMRCIGGENGEPCNRCKKQNSPYAYIFLSSCQTVRQALTAPCAFVTSLPPSDVSLKSIGEGASLDPSTFASRSFSPLVVSQLIHSRFLSPHSTTCDPIYSKRWTRVQVVRSFQDATSSRERPDVRQISS